MPLETRVRLELDQMPSFPLFNEAIQKTLYSICNYHEFRSLSHFGTRDWIAFFRGSLVTLLYSMCRLMIAFYLNCQYGIGSECMLLNDRMSIFSFFFFFLLIKHVLFTPMLHVSQDQTLVFHDHEHVALALLCMHWYWHPVYGNPRRQIDVGEIQVHRMVAFPWFRSSYRDSIPGLLIQSATLNPDLAQRGRYQSMKHFTSSLSHHSKALEYTDHPHREPMDEQVDKEGNLREDLQNQSIRKNWIKLQSPSQSPESV